MPEALDAEEGGKEGKKEGRRDGGRRILAPTAAGPGPRPGSDAGPSWGLGSTAWSPSLPSPRRGARDAWLPAASSSTP